jgi:hypothetical protein
MRVKNQNQAVSYRQGKLGDLFFLFMKIRIFLSAGHQLPLQVHPHGRTNNKRTPPSSPSISS